MSIISFSSEAQVYLSKIYNDILILGPNNVAPHCDEIAMSYISEIEYLYDILIKEQEQLKGSVREIQLSSNPTKGQLFILGEQQGDIELIEEELTTLMVFKELWLNIMDQTPVKLELVDLIRAGHCVDISTGHGKFSTNEYMVTLDKDISTIKVVEHFEIEYRDSIPQWVTKIDENCASNDPNNCKVWCFLNQPGGDVLIDFKDDIYKLDKSVIASQFDISTSDKFASRILTIDLEGATIDIVNVVKSDTNMLLQLEGFSTVDCIK